MNTFQASDGIAPQIDVLTNTTADRRIDALRPYKSASTPHNTEPVTVPMSAKNGTSDACARVAWYSLIIPGTTNPRLAGFITSITSATTRATINPQCAGLSAASSGA